MKKTILFGSLLSILILVMMPNINAVNYQIHENLIEEKINSFKDNVIKFKSELSTSNILMSIISIIFLLFYIQGFIFFFDLLLDLLYYTPYWPGSLPFIVALLLSFFLSVFWPLTLIWVMNYQ